MPRMQARVDRLEAVASCGSSDSGQVSTLAWAKQSSSEGRVLEGAPAAQLALGAHAGRRLEASPGVCDAEALPTPGRGRNAAARFAVGTSRIAPLCTQRAAGTPLGQLVRDEPSGGIGLEVRQGHDRSRRSCSCAQRQPVPWASLNARVVVLPLPISSSAL
jgi:hypothetical protein